MSIRKKTRLRILPALLPLLLLTALGQSAAPRPPVELTAAQASVIASRPQMTREERREDAEYIVGVLADNYPLFAVNERRTGTDWLANREFYIRQMTEAANDEGFLDALTWSLNDLHDGHTHVVDGLFAEQLYRIYGEYGSDDAWNAEMHTFSVLRRYMMNNQLLPIERGRPLNLYAYGSYDEVEDGYVYTAYDVEPVTLHWPELRLAYLRLPTFDYDRMQEESSGVLEFLRGLRPDTTLVIDIRGNPGGSTAYWAQELVPYLTKYSLSQDSYLLYRGGEFQQPFMRDLTYYQKIDVGEDIAKLLKRDLPELPPEAATDFKRYMRNFNYIVPSPDFHVEGPKYVLVDSGVYSAAESFASFAKDSGLATLIGTTTGGGGLSTGPILCALPHSGYLVRFPQELALGADGRPNEEFRTEPDVRLDAPYEADIDPLEDPAVREAMKLAH
ncbi:S41 family peptidase [Saccharibacillus sp. CPCC 101409]|uniref:S41 family peptidase n=1 Tax=Saccharibacillus sp. CPCC 101409 TaxID=3058041 RepID=UPI002672282E|nr:S41 family peptidase [Saccharibacillus sp. CPCC 101409]MDO3413322.1 S41 family peptidase [Saccharibacillus sp. CPCC 101409]